MRAARRARPSGTPTPAPILAPRSLDFEGGTAVNGVGAVDDDEADDAFVEAEAEPDGEEDEVRWDVVVATDASFVEAKAEPDGGEDEVRWDVVVATEPRTTVPTPRFRKLSAFEQQP